MFTCLISSVCIYCKRDSEAHAYKYQKAQYEFHERARGRLFHSTIVSDFKRYTCGMNKATGILLAALLFPLVTFAQSAGFPEKTLWLSNMSPSVGAKVQIYSILYNATDTTKKGSLVFLVDEGAVGALDVSLPSGESRIYSVPWTATSGSHNFSAKFGAEGSQSAQVSTSLSISIAEPPSPVAQALSDVKSVSTQVIASSTPVVQKIAGKIFASTEAVRNAGVAFLENQIDTPARKGTGMTNVEGFLAPSSSSSSTPSETSALHNMTQVAAAAALFAFKTSWLFYFLALILCYLLFRFAKSWVNRPRF